MSIAKSMRTEQNMPEASTTISWPIASAISQGTGNLRKGQTFIFKIAQQILTCQSAPNVKGTQLRNSDRFKTPVKS